MRTKVVLLLSFTILVTALVWLVLQPSPEPIVAALAALVGVLSQVTDRAGEQSSSEAHVDIEGSERSLLVLPFSNLSRDEENEYFSDGLTEELIAALAHVPSLRVISRHSAMRLKGTERPLVELARELSVAFVVEGGVRKSGDSVRITIHLVDAPRDSEIWSETYDGTLEDIFSFQEQVASGIVEALHLRIGPDRPSLARAPSDVRAFEAYLRGRHELGNWSREASENARHFFRKGLELLGENALLHAGLGHASFRLAHIVPGAMDKFMTEAEASAQRALDLDPNLVTGHVLYGLVDWKKGSIGSALRHFCDALEPDPDDVDALAWAVFCFAEVGDIDFVLEHVRRLLLLDPLNSFTQYTVAYAAALSSKLTDAAEALERSLSLDAESTNTLALAALIDFRLGNESASRARLTRMIQMGRDDVWTHLGSALLAAIEERPIELPDRVVSDCRKDETFAWFLAECHAIQGEPSQVVEWLDCALEWGFSNTSYLQSQGSAVSALTEDPKFAEWVVRADLRRRQVLATARGGALHRTGDAR